MKNGISIDKIAQELEKTDQHISEITEKNRTQTEKELLLSLVISNYEIADEYITGLLEKHSYEEAFKITQRSPICEFTLYRNSK